MIACDRRAMLGFVTWFRRRDLLPIVSPSEAGFPGDVSEDVYLTDGPSLFRVTGTYNAGVLWGMGLRRVRATASLDAQGAGR